MTDIAHNAATATSLAQRAAIDAYNQAAATNGVMFGFNVGRLLLVVKQQQAADILVKLKY